MAHLPPAPKKYKGVLIGCWVGLLFFVVTAVYGDHGLIHLLRMRNEQHNLEQLVFQIQQSNEQLRQRIRRLQSDDSYIERLAHERLGLVRPGEIILRVLPPPHTVASHTAADPTAASANEAAPH